MFDMSWGEIMVIGGVALVVIGPKDLPRALRTLGQMTGKVRRMAGEFHSQFNEAMREAELEDAKKEIEGLNRSVSAATSTAFNPIQTIRDEIRASVESRPSSIVSAPAPPGMAIPAADHATSPVSSAPHAEVPGDDGPRSTAEEAFFEAGHRPPPRGEGVGGDRPDSEVYGLNPDVQPLVPVPVDEPPLPAPAHPNGHLDRKPAAADPAPDADPTRLVTGPGLEPVVEPEMPRERRAAPENRA